MTPSRKSRAAAISRAREPLVIVPKQAHRHELLLEGKLPPEEMTIDELRLGRGLNEDGSVPRGRHKPVPARIRSQIDRELRTRLLQEFNRYGQDAIEVITDVMYRGEGASAFQGQKDGVRRLDAAKYVIERIVGPIPTKSEISTDVTVWQGLQESGALFVDIDLEEEDEPERKPEPRTRGPRTRPARKAIPPSG